MKRKGLKVILNKTKVIVSSGEGGVKVVSKVIPCGVCDTRVKANSILCVACNKWVHNRCIEGIFQYERCTDGDVAEDVVGIGRVVSFVYLGDVEGGCMNAVTLRTRVVQGFECGQKWSVKMNGKLYKICVRTAMIYDGDTWTMREW